MLRAAELGPLRLANHRTPQPRTSNLSLRRTARQATRWPSPRALAAECKACLTNTKWFQCDIISEIPQAQPWHKGFRIIRGASASREMNSATMAAQGRTRLYTVASNEGLNRFVQAWPELGMKPRKSFPFSGQHEAWRRIPRHGSVQSNCSTYIYTYICI